MKTEPMSRELALTLLMVCQEEDDTESAHGDADDVLCELLIALGYQDVVDEYHKVDKWYA